MKATLTVLASAVLWLTTSPDASAADSKFDLSKDAAEALRTAKDVKLYILDPETPLDPTKEFHGWTILGVKTVKGKEGETLAKEVLSGVQKSDKKMAFREFKPRYGLQVMYKNKAFDFVLDFEHLHSVVYEGDSATGATVRHTADAAEEFKAAAKKAN